MCEVWCIIVSCFGVLSNDEGILFINIYGDGCNFMKYVWRFNLDFFFDGYINFIWGVIYMYFELCVWFLINN